MELSLLQSPRLVIVFFFIEYQKQKMFNNDEL